MGDVMEDIKPYPCCSQESRYRMRYKIKNLFSGSREELAEIDANIRLISAAPDMAEALLEIVAKTYVDENTGRICFTDDFNYGLIEAALKKAGIE